MAAPLVSAIQLARDSRLPAPSTIKVKSLHATIQGPQDAWGRPDRPQPIAISAAVSLDAPFGASSATDTVATDTVHYGLLSKAILSILPTAAPAGSLRHLLDTMWTEMTGFDSRGRRHVRHQQPFLHFAQLRALEITLRLPKATLLGEGVSLTVAGGFEAAAAAADSEEALVKSVMRQSAVSLRIHGLRVPTLVGVNSNERLAKQVVVASVEIDRLEDDLDVYPELEQVVVQVCCQAPTSLTTSLITLELVFTNHLFAPSGHLGLFVRDSRSARKASHSSHLGTPTCQACAVARRRRMGYSHLAGEANRGTSRRRGLCGDEHQHKRRIKLKKGVCKMK